jgi:hypothetical protein
VTEFLGQISDGISDPPNKISRGISKVPDQALSQISAKNE